MEAQVWAALFGGAAVGALVTFLGTLLNGWLTRRHEHRRWLLDKRLEAYSAMNTAIGTWLRAYAHLERVGLPALMEASGDLADKQQAVRLVASPATRDRAQAVLAVALEANIPATAAVEEHRELNDDEMNAVLDELSTHGQALFETQLVDIERGPKGP